MPACTPAPRRHYSRRESIIDAIIAFERRAGHPDADARARLIVDIQDALDDHVLSRADGCREADVPDGAPFDGRLPTERLCLVLVAIRGLPR